MAAQPTFIIEEVSRRTTNGNVEFLKLRAGVNLIVGAPNTGKTKWLETIDYLLGDPGEDPFSVAADDALAEKYEAAGLRFRIAGELFYAERRWKEAGGKSRVYVNDATMSAKEFQKFLMQKLEIPILTAPSGNPFSERTWPELSFRTLLRHFYRQQRLWTQLVDKQPEDTFKSAVLCFLGLAEHLYTEDYEGRVRLTNEIQKLSGRRDQFSDTLSDIARDFLDEDSLTLSITDNSLQLATSGLKKIYDATLDAREVVLQDAINASLSSSARSEVIEVSEERSNTLSEIVAQREAYSHFVSRVGELEVYAKSLRDEADRFRRAESASNILSDLRITHCPACSQTVRGSNLNSSSCFLCHQDLAQPEIPEELAKQRVEYERLRLDAELAEAGELLAHAAEQAEVIGKRIERLELKLADIDRRLAPARQHLSGLIQSSVSELDNKLGSIAERLKQVDRLTSIFNERKLLDERILALEGQLRPIVDRNNELARGLDYARRASWLENGMNDYLTALNSERPGTWRHKAVHLYLSQSTATFRVGDRRWDYSLGGTDSLYYLMAYNFGLMTLTLREGARFPGFTMLDFPAEFAGTNIGDAENFVVQPFIDLLARDGLEDCQLILTGASFSGLAGVNRIELKTPYLS